MAALVRPHLDTLHTFAGGLEGRLTWSMPPRWLRFCSTDHHEVIVSVPGLRKALPDVIYHLESFDALLVRSTLINYPGGGGHLPLRQVGLFRGRRR